MTTNETLYRIDGPISQDFPLISFSTNVYDNPADIFGSITDLARHFKAVEFEIGEDAEQVFWSLSAEERVNLARQIRRFTEHNGITLTVHAGWWGRQYNLCSPDLAERAQAVDCLSAAVDFSREAGATSVTFHPGYKDQLENAELLDNLINAINQVRTRCNTDGIALCLENMGGQRPKFPVFTVEEHLRFHQETGCFVTIDVTHLCSLLPYGESLFEAIAGLAPITRHLHIADLNDTHHQHLPIGEGNLRLSDVLNRFAVNGYRGVAVVEEFIPRFSTEYYLEKALAYKKGVEELLAGTRQSTHAG
ncbi:sugar phosphate isomerase/epimerase family protein [Pseudomonas sp. IAC-BECa141]|uniref:sugar phosphate isomerase/epimerase family protein n=1 Tax=Pseudomonas sp. IAC-BECa141 TaxID=2793103 RepID=UPI001D06FF01|nr:sugar phosphate isomerase/epimerase family protein [Pseudomonas sp. IAC-BECa141]UDI90528.1 TIM barrel protein [Pseudomonas sp. IAC-BECa141]